MNSEGIHQEEKVEALKVIWLRRDSHIYFAYYQCRIPFSLQRLLAIVSFHMKRYFHWKLALVITL
jgi:hypothetical protein